MQTIQLILASTLFFYGKVIGTQSVLLSLPPVPTSINKSNKNNLITKSPTLLRFNKFANHSQFKNLDLTSKNAPITAKINSSRTSSNTSTYINNLAGTLMNDTDNLNNTDQNTISIYNNVLLLLVHRIQTWLTSNATLNSISTYLGYPPETIHIMNAAFTELLYQQRKGLIDISNLAKAFFYSCDIKHMRDNNTEDKTNVTEEFKSFLSKFGFANNDVKDYEEIDIVNSLKWYINSMDAHVNPSYSVTIPLMKNRIFVDESKNETVNKLKARFIDEYQTNDAKSYEKEIDVTRITENHVNLIGKLIPDIFGFVYNHFELLTELRNYELNKLEDVLAVKRFSRFLNYFMEIFINRYFEFKNEIDLPFLDAIYPLIDFINPNSALEKPNISIFDYKNEDGTYDDYMWTLMNNALEKLLAVFENENIEEWKKNRSCKIDYTSESLSKDELINLMNNNTEDAYGVLGMFVSDFVNGVELYNTYKLNISEWPAMIY